MEKVFFIKFQIYGTNSILIEFFSNKEKRKKAVGIIEANGHKIIRKGSMEEADLSAKLKSRIDCGYGVRVTPMGLKTK